MLQIAVRSVVWCEASESAQPSMWYNQDSRCSEPLPKSCTLLAPRAKLAPNTRIAGNPKQPNLVSRRGPVETASDPGRLGRIRADRRRVELCSLHPRIPSWGGGRWAVSRCECKRCLVGRAVGGALHCGMCCSLVRAACVPWQLAARCRLVGARRKLRSPN
ncbi:hypothetical protein VUR80DRAFT_8774 [Thermomyces stellatus]